MPALRGLAEKPATRRHTAYQRLCAAALQHLQARAAQVLAAPADWRRDANLSCRCVHCNGLRQFLLSASEPSWRFKAKELDRDHVQQSIQQGRCDLDCTVERKGSPHVLVCTKNDASYAARVRQRKADLCWTTCRATRTALPSPTNALSALIPRECVCEFALTITAASARR